jgi:LPXTG-motif cell wall-anchored protein
MKAMDKNKSILRFINLFFRSLVAIVIALFYTGMGSLFAQTDSTEKANVPNEAMKSVFQQMKKEVKTNDTLSSILMIIGVLLIVGVAVYLSFKSGPEDKKPPLKSSAPKKA